MLVRRYDGDKTMHHGVLMWASFHGMTPDSITLIKFFMETEERKNNKMFQHCKWIPLPFVSDKELAPNSATSQHEHTSLQGHLIQ